MSIKKKCSTHIHTTKVDWYCINCDTISVTKPFCRLKSLSYKNAYSSVEADELRLAFEDVSDWIYTGFWSMVFGVGHPNLDINYAYDDVSKSVTIDVSQREHQWFFPFILPLTLLSIMKVHQHNGTKGTVKKLRDTILIKMSQQTWCHQFGWQ